MVSLAKSKFLRCKNYSFRKQRFVSLLLFKNECVLHINNNFKITIFFNVTRRNVVVVQFLIVWFVYFTIYNFACISLVFSNIFFCLNLCSEFHYYSYANVVVIFTFYLFLLLFVLVYIFYILLMSVIGLLFVLNCIW